MNETLIVAALLSLHAVGLAYSATTHSPTSLEPAFLAAGVSHWQLGRFELYRVNPPLVRLLAALPVLAAGCETDWHQFHDGPGARPEFAIGSDFVHANGPRALYLLQLARWSCIPFSLIGAWFAFRWASELYGRRAGWVTLVLWCFDPNLLAHAEWITPDIACTGLGVAAGYSFWLWLRQGGWLRALITGAALGLVQLSKMSWLMLFGLWPLIWLVYSRMSNERRARSHELSPLAAADRDRLRGQWFRRLPMVSFQGRARCDATDNSAAGCRIHHQPRVPV